MKKRINLFNMIEVALSMAIIAIGMTSILGLFPVGLNASRTAMAENYSADAVEYIFGYLKNLAESSQISYYQVFLPTNTNSLPDNNALGTNWINTYRTATVGGPGTPLRLDDISHDFLKSYPDFTAPAYTYNPILKGLYNFKDGNTTPYLYFVLQGSPDSKSYDFSAMVLVWRCPVFSLVATGDASISGNWSQWPVAADNYLYMSGLNIEISWPLEKSYTEREKRFYYFVFSRPQ